MAGIGLVLDIARNALFAQRYGIDVTAHNIANVNTAGYTRQRPDYEAKASLSKGGMMIGQGVDTSTISRVSDQFVENQLMQQKSNLLHAEEMAKHVPVLESLFDENTDSSISRMLSEFWNLWHGITNNPSGSPERIALYEHSVLLSEQLNAMDEDLKQLEKTLTQSVGSGIDKINQITGMIAGINNTIVSMESESIANDLRDQRNALLTELAEYIDVNSFEQDNGTLSVVTAKGCTVVHGNSSYEVALGGVGGDRVEWQGSGGTTVDITKYIENGSIGGSLDMRDEILAKYRRDLDALAKAFVWTVNQQHSQGVGLDTFSTVTGDFAATSAGDAVGSSNSGLTFYDRITDGSFKVWLYDANGDVVVGGGTTINIDADITPLYDVNPGTDDIATKIDEINANIAATVTNGRLEITCSNGYTFAFSDDTSNALAALGINTYFEGSGAGGIQVNDTIGADKDLIAAAWIDNTGTFAKGDNRNAIAISDLQYTAVNISQWSCDRISGNAEGTISASIENYYHGLIGSMGIVADNISSGKAFNEMMVNKISELRDSISAVSLDEEMTNLIKFQHAYTAASKLVQASDEMLKMLLDIK